MWDHQRLCLLPDVYRSWHHLPNTGSYLVLLPEENVGPFDSYNSVGGSKANDIIKQAFLDCYYPVPDSSALQPPADFQQRAGQLTGSYRTTRSSYTTYEKVTGLLMGGVDIRATEDHLLLNSKQFVEVNRLSLMK